MAYLQGNDLSFVFKKTGVSGPGFTSRNAKNYADLYIVMMQRAKEYASIVYPEKLEDGYIIHDFNVKGTGDNCKYTLVFVKNGEADRVNVPGGLFFADNVSKFHKDQILIQKREDKKNAQAIKDVEDRRLAEAKRLNEIEEIERLIAESSVKLAILKGE